VNCCLTGLFLSAFRFGIDWEHGGVLSCIHEDGALASEDKFIWSQARSVWTFSALSTIAWSGCGVFCAPPRTPSGSCWLTAAIDRARIYPPIAKGEVIEAPGSAFTADCFAVYGFSEYTAPPGTSRRLRWPGKHLSAYAAAWRARFSGDRSLSAAAWLEKPRHLP